MNTENSGKTGRRAGQSFSTANPSAVLSDSYDVAVIGSGPGGQRAAIQAAQKGRKVIVIERRLFKVGGVSLHTGTIPSKTLREAVIYLRGLRRRKIYGPSHRFSDDITLEDLMERVKQIWDYEMQLLDTMLRQGGVDVIYGQASFVDPHRLRVENQNGEVIGRIRADKIIIATGTSPSLPEDIPFDYESILDSNFIFSSKCHINRLPRSLIVYGAGVIGSEYAAMFAALGSKVHLLDSHEQMFPFIDHDILKILMDSFAEMNMEIHLGQKYKKISRTSDGKARLETDKGLILEADAILFSKGRKPCIEPLRLENAGVLLGERDVIRVDDHYRTNVEHIFACGDVIGFPALASVSAEQGRIAARYALNLSVPYHKPELFPLAIYTIPEMSSIGKTENQLIKENIPYLKGVSGYRDIAKAAISGDITGALKLLFHRDSHALLGVHLIGDQASEIIHIGQIVMTFNGDVEYFVRNVFNYPSWAEGYKLAALEGLNPSQEPAAP